MSVTRVELKNFKTHKDLEWRDISPGVNLLLGGNGQGKSTLHLALLFVFSDVFSPVDSALQVNQVKTTPTKRDLLTVELQVTPGAPPTSDSIVCDSLPRQFSGEDPE